MAATNRNLDKAIEQGEFREDLFYRLNVFSITVPTLRERKEDIPALVEAFCRHQAERLQRPITGLSQPALEAMMAYDWPGNVRELQNVIERAAIVTDSGEIGTEHLPAAMESAQPRQLSCRKRVTSTSTKRWSASSDTSFCTPTKSRVASKHARQTCSASIAIACDTN